MDNVMVFDHPLIQHKISILRNKATGTNEFRALIEEIAMLMGYEAVSYTHLMAFIKGKCSWHRQLASSIQTLQMMDEIRGHRNLSAEYTVSSHGTYASAI